MKLILATTQPNLDSTLGRQFGTAPYFIAIDLDSMAWEAIPNPGGPTPHTAGARAAIMACRQRPDAVISQDFGPYCYIGLEAADIPMYLCSSCKTVREAIAAFKAGELTRTTGGTGMETVAQGD